MLACISKDIKREIITPTKIDNNSLDEVHDDKELLQYLETCQYMGIDSLQLALECKKSTEAITKIIDVGGQQYLIIKDEFGFNALHHACVFRASTEAILKMIEVGGQDLVMEKNQYRSTALHDALVHKALTEAVMKMIEVGGEQEKR